MQNNERTTKVDVHPELFEEIKRVGHRISRLGAIVQNDMTIPEHQYEGFIEQYKELRSDMKEWMKKTCTHVAGPDREKFE